MRRLPLLAMAAAALCAACTPITAALAESGVSLLLVRTAL